MVSDLVEPATRLATDPGDPETYNTGTSLLFGIAGLAAAGCTPAELIIGGLGPAYHGATMVNPNLTKDIVTGVGAAVDATWAGAAEVAQDVISGGLNAVRNMFSF